MTIQKLKPWPFALALAAALATQPAAFAQGSLTPPGAPAPTMKTLDQVRPGTPITNLPYTITSTGVYYVTRSMNSSSSGITINSDDVLLDLGGFTLTGDGQLVAGDHGVVISSKSRVIVRNGTLQNFTDGLFLFSTASQISLEDLNLIGNGADGLYAQQNAAPSCLTNSVIRRVRCVGNAASGMSLLGGASTPLGRNIVDQCEAINNGAQGFLIGSRGNLIIRNTASGNGGGNYEIAISNRVGEIVTPPLNASILTTTGGGTGTTDPFANIRF